MRKTSSKENFDLDVRRGDSTEFDEVITCPACKGYGAWVFIKDNTQFMIYLLKM
jgi:hypothetical protein